MKSESGSTLDSQRRLWPGILVGIVLIAALIIIAVFIPRFTEKGPYKIPAAAGDGWETASLGHVGMDEQPIQELLTRLAQQNTYNIHSLLVVKDGKLVLEAYYPGDDITFTDTLSFTRKDFDRDTLHCTASVTKSITSILFGIALEQGNISGVDEKLFDDFPEYSGLSGGEKGDITLRQMLTMTSGIPWDESYPYTDSRNDLGHMMLFSPDPIEYVLQKRLTSRPGETFMYNSGTANLLGEIVHRKSGTLLTEYARKNLFQPLGITASEWPVFPNAPQMAVASSLLYLKPRDMAKIGQLYLQQGSWDGMQIVSPQWVQESTAISTYPGWDFGPSFENTGYGYLWWRGKFANGATDTIFAAGWGGQFIMIMPEINTVVVTTGSNYSNGYSDVFSMIDTYVLGSIYAAP